MTLLRPTCHPANLRGFLGESVIAEREHELSFAGNDVAIYGEIFEKFVHDLSF